MNPPERAAFAEGEGGVPDFRESYRKGMTVYYLYRGAVKNGGR